MSLVLEQWQLMQILYKKYSFKPINSNSFLARHFTTSKENMVRIYGAKEMCDCKEHYHFDIICRQILVILHRYSFYTDFYTVTHRDVQKSLNDCGLSCLANLFSLCMFIDPSQLGYKQKEMRAHFNKCLLNKKFRAFPLASLMRKNIIDNIYIYECKTKDFIRKQ